jgi:hypothetical protein
MTMQRATLAQRMGTTVHVSPLRFKLEGLRQRWPLPDGGGLEDWLVETANARGARIVVRAEPARGFQPPPCSCVSNEELVVGMCQLQCLDEPQMLRLAAQLISRGAVDVPRLCRLGRRERAGRVLAELARQALRVEPEHAAWRAVLNAFQHEPLLRDTLLHWTRLAQPVMPKGRANPVGWRLAA